MPPLYATGDEKEKLEMLLEQMTVLFLLMGVGYLCYKKSIITDEVSKKLSAIVVNVANPALVLTACMGEDRIRSEELLTTVIIMAAMYPALLIMAEILPVVLRVKKEKRGIYKAMTAFSNIGFMGFPVITALYGNGALLYATPFIIVYNILIYTYGISAIKGEKKSEKGKRSLSVGKLFNAGMISCVITIIIYLFDLPTPVFLQATVTHLSNLTAPLSMMIIGASLAVMDVKELFRDGRMLLFSLIKLLILPGAGILIIRLFVQNQVILGVCMVMLATPVGSMTAMLAQQYGGDYETAARGVALSTVLSVATLPLISMLVV